ncbi:prepilin-type N-terminal cleavage/methylation domain-containing protein [Pseudoduganella sp. FT26W]|uniref:Prepilin-type N-terminal cleavage/methylation domain-containing protein n=1 Tax=Duganella aquatilis TaxID=2666082 RepID=A0A844D6Y8_9BURK|nr:prepilin-type N-terminal cleavage/methylation domain-containing protein [Duganella aquatilis]MRW82524.1 prepilin-type N-terminal cleavage/methylation domain-containing protein [Duganella aquatilis]
MFVQLSRGRSTGFTLIEMMVAIVVMGVLMAIAIPNMSAWLMATRARSAAEFYKEGFTLARRLAVSHNSASRITFTVNPTTGQMDWQVDLCFPIPGSPCNNLNGSWSTVDAAAGGDPQGAAGDRSVFRAASALSTTDVLTPTIAPQGANAIYYTALGWVDPTIQPRVAQLRLDPSTAFAHDVPVSAVTVSLAGMPTQCDPTRDAGDSRACPP